MIADPISILITDDDANFRETLEGVFVPRGFRTLLAADGQEALDIVYRDQVHLILMDMHMPRLGGIETLRRVKQFKSILPCILMSAGADQQMIDEAQRADAFTVLRKPVSRMSVIDSVQLALRQVYNWHERT